MEQIDLVAGVDTAVALMRSPGKGRRSAAKFMAAHALMILGWRAAGLANKDIAAWLAAMGYPLEPSYFRRLIAGVAKSADSAEVAAMGAAVSRRLLEAPDAAAQAALRPTRAAPPTGRFQPAGLAPTPVPSMSAPARSVTKPALNGAEVMARMAAMRWVDIEDEDGDWSEALTPGAPRSFGDLRRRLWEAANSDPPRGHVEFDDKKRLDIPQHLRLDLFAARIASWPQLLDRLG